MSLKHLFLIVLTTISLNVMGQNDSINILGSSIQDSTEIKSELSLKSTKPKFGKNYFDTTNFIRTHQYPELITRHNHTYAPLKYTHAQLLTPVILTTIGLSTIVLDHGILKDRIANFRNEHMAYFHFPIDDYLRFTPALLYGFDLVGIKSKTDIQNRTAIYIKAQILSLGVSTLLKNMVREQRPDKSNYQSFPSGHTTQAFMAAAIFSEEYKDQFKWAPYASYAVASSMGLLRMANNKHYIGDVLIGAAIGILSTKISYWTHQYKW